MAGNRLKRIGILAALLTALIAPSAAIAETLPPTVEPTPTSSSADVPEESAKPAPTPSATLPSPKPSAERLVQPMLAAPSVFQCNAGDTYTVRGIYVDNEPLSGEVRRISPTGQQTLVGHWVFPPKYTRSANALGIGRDGQSAYSIAQYGDDLTGMRIGTYTPQTGWTVGPLTTAPGFPANQTIVAGAVDLVTGNFLFGAYSRGSETETWKFYLWSYNPNTGNISALGNFDTELTMKPANGDMAFDANGNLYVVMGPDKQVAVFSVTAKTIRDAQGSGRNDPNYRFPASATALRPTEMGVVTGISFNADGTVMLASGKIMEKYDPSTWTKISSVTTSLTNSSDLASCVSPPTLTVKKDIVGRDKSTDQFDLSFTREGDTAAVTSARTEGSANGVQDQFAGPFPVRAGANYVIEEKLVGGNVATGYTTTYECKVGNNVIASGTAARGTVKIPEIASGQTEGAAVECMFTNTPIPTKLKLTKSFDVKYGAPRDASTWQLTAKRGSDATINFASGEEKLVKDGTFTISETAKPGYRLKQVECTVSGGAKQVFTPNASGSVNVNVPRYKLTDCTLINQDLPGSIRWEKLDSATKQRLAGSVWRLDGPNGYSKEIADYSGNQQGLLDIDASPGGFEVGNLVWGTYTLTEVKAPAGYLPLKGESATVTVDGINLRSPTPMPIDNKKILVNLEKYGFAERGQSTPELIDGSSFAIYTDAGGAPGDQVGTVDSRGVGKFELSGLSLGKYWVVETTAPRGHNLLAEPIGITLTQSDAGELVINTDGPDGVAEVTQGPATLKVYDQRTITLPISGGSGAWMYIAGGAALLILATALAISVRRRKG